MRHCDVVVAMMAAVAMKTIVAQIYLEKQIFYVYRCFACISHIFQHIQRPPTLTFLVVGGCLICQKYGVSVHHHRPEKSISSPAAGGRGSCELPCRCWESNRCPREEQPVLWGAELSLQHQQIFFCQTPPYRTLCTYPSSSSDKGMRWRGSWEIWNCRRIFTSFCNPGF